MDKSSMPFRRMFFLTSHKNILFKREKKSYKQSKVSIKSDSDDKSQTSIFSKIDKFITEKIENILRFFGIDTRYKPLDKSTRKPRTHKYKMHRKIRNRMASKSRMYNFKKS